MQELEQQIGKIVGVWGLHLVGFHNANGLLYFHENGNVNSPIGVKKWALCGPFLLLMDARFNMKHIFRYHEHQETAVVLVNVITANAKRYFLRSCGEKHTLTGCYENMVKAEDVNILSVLAMRKDLSLQIEPGTDILVPLQEHLTIDHFADDPANRYTPAYRIALNPQPVTIPPIYVAILNDAKIMSCLVVEKADGRCLRESISCSDTGTEHYAIHCYPDYKNQVQYYPDVEPVDRIEGLCIFIENGYGIDHWLIQSIPCIYILDWLEKSGVDCSKIKVLLRRGFNCPEHKEAFKAAGWLDKIPKSSWIDLSRLSPAVKIDQLIFPSFMWLITGENCPPNYNFSLYALSRKVKTVYDRIKQNVLQNLPACRSYPPLVFLLRRTKLESQKRLLNEDELLHALEPLGFVGVDPAALDLAGKIALYHNARVITGAKSGEFTLTLFCKPGTHVHMLCHRAPYDFDHAKIIADMTGAKFSCIIYDETPMPQDDYVLWNQRCFYADIDEVVDSVKKILALPEFADLQLPIKQPIEALSKAG